MAIKTQTELVTQSNNTFLDNTTGQIIPTNHRQWNDDLLETMFEGIVGRTMTANDFDTLVTNSELVEGSRYRITGITDSLYGAAEIIVTAKTANTLDEIGFLFANSFATQFLIKISAASPLDYNLMFEVLDFNYGVSSAAFLSNINKFGLNNPFVVVPQNTTKHKYIDNIKSSSGGSGNRPINHNIFNHRTNENPVAPYDVFYGSGFFPINPFTSAVDFDYYYEDHGSTNSWGTANISTAGSLGYITIDGVSAGNLIGNFQKVNSMVFGMIQFDSTINFADAPNISFEFSLPFFGMSSGWEDTITGHGHGTISGANHTILCDITKSATTATQKGKCNVVLIGTHNQLDDVTIRFSFSYSLDPS